jgi:hypothetical protein
MIRRVLAVIAGFVVSVIGIDLVEAIGALVAPVPAAPNLANVTAMGVYLASKSWQSYAFDLGAYVLGTVAGVVVAASIVRVRSRAVWVVGGLVLATTVANLVILPHPVWFSVAAVVAVALGAVLGMQLGPIQSMRRAV